MLLIWTTVPNLQCLTGNINNLASFLFFINTKNIKIKIMTHIKRINESFGYDGELLSNEVTVDVLKTTNKNIKKHYNTFEDFGRDVCGNDSNLYSDSYNNEDGTLTIKFEDETECVVRFNIDAKDMFDGFMEQLNWFND